MPIRRTRRLTCAWPRSIDAAAVTTRPLESLKKASAIMPDSMEVKFNIAVIDQAQGTLRRCHHHPEPVAAEDRAHQRSVRSPRKKAIAAIFLERLGTIYRDANKPQLAIDTFRRMFDLGDENAIRGYQEIIETYRDQKQWQQATTHRGGSGKAVPQ